MSTKRWTLLAVCLGTFMLLLDITVVNVELPDIQRELDASFTDLFGLLIMRGPMDRKESVAT